MITRLQIENFQAHEQFRLDLSEPVVTVVGPSDSGKSSIMRAIRWLLTNKPGGDAFVRDGSDGAEVKILVDGKTITRGRGKENTYKLDKQTFKAFGANVPEPIADLLSVGPLNFQGQHDSAFWFSLTAGEVAKRLNAIVDLEVIDRSQGRLAGIVRRVRTERDVTEERLKQAQLKEEDLKWVPAASAELAGVRKLAGELGKYRERTACLASVGLALRKRAREASILKGAAESGQGALTVMADTLKVKKRRRILADLLEEIRTAKAKASRKPPVFTVVAEAHKLSEETVAAASGIRELLKNIRRAEERVEDATTSWIAAVRDMKEKAVGACPLCGGELK